MTTEPTANAPEQTGVEPTSNENKYLSFCLGKEEYGIEILRIREIIGIMDITPLPRTPDYVEGVINLRGRIIPVIDLRTRFGMPGAEHTEQTCVIVVEVADTESGEQFLMGLVVDTVCEVLSIPPDAIEPAPKLGGNVNTTYITGMGKHKERVIALLCIDQVMSASEVAETRSAVTGVETPEVAAA